MTNTKKVIEPSLKSKKVHECDLTDFGFVDNKLETQYHEVTYVFYDIGRLMINSKPDFGDDDVYIEDYFTLEKFRNIIHAITGFKIKLYNEYNF